MDMDLLLGVSVKANLNSEINEFGLVVRVGELRTPTSQKCEAVPRDREG
jgi:hypothetical protein